MQMMLAAVILITVTSVSVVSPCSEHHMDLRYEITRHITELTEELRHQAQNSESIRCALGLLRSQPHIELKQQLQSQPGFQPFHKLVTGFDTIYKDLYLNNPLDKLTDLAKISPQVKADLTSFVTSAGFTSRLKKILNSFGKMQKLYDKNSTDAIKHEFENVYQTMATVPHYKVFVKKMKGLGVDVADYLIYVKEDLVAAYLFYINSCLKKNSSD